MPTWRDLWRQRVRWQTGAIRDLLGYGRTRVTLPYWLRQGGIYASLMAALFCWAVIAAAFTRHPAFNAAWTGGVLAVTFTERLWTVRRAGWRGMLLSALMVPELTYDTFRMAVFIWSAIATLARVDLAWGHVVKQAAR